MSFRWNRELIEKLIFCVGQNPCIYAVKCDEYMDRNKRAKAYNSILEELSFSEPSMTLLEIKRKWKNLRTQYSQELRRLNLSKRNGAGTDHTYIPKLWCFKKLHFLKNHIDTKQSSNNIEFKRENLVKVTKSTQENKFDNEPTKERQNTHISVDNIINQINKFKKNINAYEKKYAWLGSLVVSRMEEIHPDEQEDAAWQVQCFMQKLITASKRRRQTQSTSFEEIVIQCDAYSPSKRNLLEQSLDKDILEQSMEGEEFEDIKM